MNKTETEIYSIESMQLKANNNTFRYSDRKEAKFLLGAYRSDKNQLAWFLGEQPRRFQKIYNVRLNDSLFSQRNGGITHVSKPDYILLYDLSRHSQRIPPFQDI